jgi:hypothetical protein
VFRRLIGVVVAFAAAAGAAPASGQIYWANQADGTIGRSAHDGTSVNQSVVSGAGRPRGVAIDATHVYWVSDDGAGRIGRATLDGTGVNHSFLPLTGAPFGIALDNLNLYWTQVVGGAGTVGRARLNGAGANPAFMDTGPSPCGVSVGADDVLFANRGSGSIGRAHITGSELDQAFVGGLDEPCGVALAGDWVYWADRGMDAIGRARLDGSVTEPRFISVTDPCGVAADERRVYWSSASGAIGRAHTDGTGVQPAFVTGARDPCGIAVAPTFEPDPASIAFAPTTAGGESDVASLHLANTASSVGAVSAVTIAGAGAAHFAVTGDGCSVNVVPPAGGCIVNVGFRPKTAGTWTAVLRLASNASDSPAEVILTGTATAAPDLERPRFLSASARPRVFRAREGTTFSYSLSEPARVRFTIANARGAVVTSFTRAANGGRNATRFVGVLRGRALPPGVYRLTLAAADAAGNRSAPRSLAFRIVAGRSLTG